jgi:hypothetical protein
MKFDNQLRKSCIVAATFILCVVGGLSLFGQIDIEFSHERGFYHSPITVSISSPEDLNATIRYTLDNSKPSPTVGNIYSGPITVNSTESIRAIAVGGLGISDVITHTYLFPNDIKDQPEMSNHIPDADVVAGLESLPAISIVSTDVFRNLHIQSEVETSIELIYPDGNEGFMTHCGIQTWGGSDTNPKKSYRFEFKSAYGDKKLDYEIFNSDTYENHEYKIPPWYEFDKLVLRTGSQDGLNGEFGNEKQAQFLRNRFLMDAAIELDFPSAHGRYVNTFVNGEYMGQYHMMERPDASFFESYFGYDKDDFEVRRAKDNYWDGTPQDNGEGVAYNSMLNNIDLSSAAGIANTNKYIDLESAAGYLVMMSYASGFDWGNNQNALCGGHETPSNVPYKFLLWDVDLSLHQGGRWHPNFSGDVNYFNAPFQNTGPVPAELTSSSEFRVMMGDQLHCACFDDGPLTAANADSLYFERAQQIDTSIWAEASRWGDVVFTNQSNVDVPMWDKSHWLTELNYMRNTFLPQRRLNIINHFKVNNSYPSIDGVVYSDNGGLFDSGYQLTLSNPNGVGTIYYTIDNVDPRQFGGAIAPAAQVYTGPITLPVGVYEVRARVKNGSTWSAMCPKEFYIGQEYKNIRINEIHYNVSDSTINGSLVDGKEFDFIELKNRGTTDVDMTDVIFDKGVTIYFPDGFTIPAGGFAILAEDAVNFQVKYGFAPDLVWEGKLDNGGETLRYVDPNKEVIDKVTYDDVFPWDALPDQGQYSLAVIDCTVSNNSPVNWLRQSVYYTPGAPNVFDSNLLPDYSSIVINEIHYHPRDSFHVGPDTLVPSKEFEFVELRNTGFLPIRLEEVQFVEGINYKFDDDTVILPGQYLVLAEDSMWFHNRYGFAAFDKYDGKLENDSDTLVLISLFNEVIDSVAYFDSGSWDPLPDLGDYSLALINPNNDHNSPTNWSHQCDFVTPGFQNNFDDDGDGTCNDQDICPNLDDNLIGSVCDDGNPCTEGETFDQNCNCTGGIFIDSDNDGDCDALDICPTLSNTLIGTSCDDGNSCTVGETYDSNCNCSGGTFTDTDNDSVCDFQDLCPGFDDTLIGTPCNDANPCTYNDVYTSTCGCAGTQSPDSDNDGVCDLLDLCSNIDDSLIGQPCDDNIICFIGSTWTPGPNNICNCSGGFYSDLDNDNVCDPLDQCPGLDDQLDSNNNGIADCQETCPDFIIENTNPIIVNNISTKIGIETNGRVLIGDLTYEAGDYVELKADFEVLQGAVFEAKIEACN